MSRSHVIVNSMIVLSCLAFLFTPVETRGQSEHTANLIEGAKKEKKLVWYTTFNLPDAKLLLDSFQKKYPFVHADLFRTSGERSINRILTETRAGRWEYDVINASQMDVLMHHKVISPYLSPQAKAFSSEFKDSVGYWTGVFANYYTLGYNTNVVTERESPRRWEDLLDPKWKGKISIDREEYAWYAALLAAWGNEKTQKYMGALAKQDIQWRKGHALIAQLMAAGEFPVAIIYGHRVEEMKKKGAPVEWVHTVDPMVASFSRIALSAQPNNPSTGKLFIDFVLSREGQEIMRSQGYVPGRADVDPPSPRMAQSKLKLKAVPQDFHLRYDDHAQAFKVIFGL